MTREEFHSQFAGQCAQSLLNLEVFSDGPLSASVAFVGEGPGETELRQGLPFVGGSGKVLWDGVRRYGFNRLSVYCTNVVKRQVSLSRTGNERHAIHRDELDKWVSLLRWELSLLPNLRTVFVLGNYALEALMDVTGITNYRGSVFDRELPNGNQGKIVCTINPAYALRELRYEPVFLMDCHKLDLAHRGVFKRHEIDEIINPSFKDAMAFIRDLKKSPKPFAFDLEKTNESGTICWGLSNNPSRAMCINLRGRKGNTFTQSQEVDLFLAFQNLCESHRMVGQNAQFDCYWSWLYEKIKINPWFDTLLAHHTLYPQLPHSLAFQVAQYTTHPFYKDDFDELAEGGDIDTFWRYNCKDAALTYSCYEKEYAELRQQKIDKFFFDHVMRATPHLIQATVHGVLIDSTVKERIKELCAADVQALENEFQRLVQELVEDEDYVPNPGSWQQLQVLFFDILKLKGKGRSTDEANRKVMMKDPGTSLLAKDMLAALDRYKEEAKFFGTYANSKVHPDDRFRCEYKQFGVSRAPGRLSSSGLLDGYGGNMQNQPVRARGMYVADPGCVFGYFDLAQAEAQVVSFRADIPTWKEQFARAKRDGSYDCHRALASEMFKVPYDQVPTKDFTDEAIPKPTIRYISKRCRHGLNYRMQMYRLSEVTGLPFHSAARAFSLYHSITPELKRWWDAEEKEFKRTREVYNALGRRFRVVQRVDETVMESLIAYYAQSTIGDWIVRSWYMAEEDDEWPDQMYARVAIDVHDNLVCISSPKYIKTCLKVLKRHAEADIYIQDVYRRRPAEPLGIPAELKMSYPSVWDEKTRKFVKDPNGLHRWSNMEVVKL